MTKLSFSRWFSMFLLMVVASAGSALAQSLSIADFYIETGKTKQVTIDLTQGNLPVLGFQADIVLPEGLSIQRVKAVSGILPVDEWGDEIIPSVSYANNCVLMYNDKGVTINDDASSLVTLYVIAADDFPGGDIKLDNIVISGEGNVKITPAAVTTKVTSNYVVPVTNDPAITISDFYIEAGKTKQVTVDLVQGYIPVLGFQADIELPKGLTIQRVKAVSGILPNDEWGDEIIPSVSYANNCVLLYNDKGVTINSDATSLVTLYFVAASDFAGGNIKLENIVISGEGNVKITPDAVAAKVTTDYVAPSTYSITYPEQLENGFMSVGNTNPTAGTTVSCKILANDGYEVKTVTIKTVTGEPVPYEVENGYVYSFVMPAADVVISVEIAKIVVGADPSITMTDFTIQSGGSAEVTIDLVQGNIPVLGFQTDIVLPAGLTIQRVKAVSGILPTDEWGDEIVPSVSYANGRILLYNDKNVTILSTAAKLVTLYFSATNDFAGGEIKLDNIIISGENNVKIQPEAVVVAVEADQPEYTYDFVEGEYLFYNVGAGKFLGAANAWGTQASFVDHGERLTLHPAYGDNTYTIETRANNGGNWNYTNGYWMDAEAVDMTLTPQSNSTYTLSNAAGNIFGYDGTAIVSDALDATSENAQWKIIPLSEAISALYDATEPMDATFLIHDPNFSRNNRDLGYWSMDAYNQNLSGGDDMNRCAESWHSTFTLSQTIEHLPGGWYALQAQGFYRDDTGSEPFVPVFFANDSFTQFPAIENGENSMSMASQSFSQGLYAIDPIYVYIEEGEPLTIGAKLEGSTMSWAIWDNFELTYLGQEFQAPVVAPKLAMNGFSIEAGSTAEVSIDLIQGTNPATYISATLNLPDGLTIVNARTADDILQTDAAGSAETPTVSYSNGHLKLGTNNDIPIKTGAKSIIILTVAADKTCQGGDLEVSDICILYKANGQLYETNPEPFSVWVSTNYIAPTGLEIVREDVALQVDEDINYDYITLGHTTDYGGHEYGALTTEGDAVITTGKFSFYSDPNIEWEYRYDKSRHSAALINNAEISAEEVTSELWIDNDMWTFLSFPYDVKVSDIIPLEENTEWVIRKYDGKQRAAGNMDNTWVTMQLDDVLEAYQGYIWQAHREGWGYSGFEVPAINNFNKFNMFAKDEVRVGLNAYGDCEFAHNRDWNLIGNPYPSYFSMKYMDFTAPITAWNVNSQSYEALMPEDDDYVFYPFEAFFVQRPDEQEYIVFSAEGRQTDRNIYYNVAPASVKANGQKTQRDVLNILLSDGTFTDRARVVVNESAFYTYEMDKDASKFMSTSSRAPQFFSVEGDIRYAINERPLGNGVVELGATFVKTGDYTIALQSMSDMRVVLEDRATGVKVELNDSEGYLFNAEAGTALGRFVLYLNMPTGVSNLNSTESADTQIFTTDGRRVQKTNAPGIYIVKKGDRVMKQSVK